MLTRVALPKGGGFSTFYWRVAVRTVKAPGQFTGREAPRQSLAPLGCRVPLVTPSPIGESGSVRRHLVLSVTPSPVSDTGSRW